MLGGLRQVSYSTCALPVFLTECVEERESDFWTKYCIAHACGEPFDTVVPEA